MEIKVTKTVGSPTRTTATLEITKGLDLPDKVKTKIKNDVGEYLIDSILSKVGDAKSPVKGESFPSLSRDYKKHKTSDGLPGKANLEAEGDLLDSLTFKTTDNGIELGFFDKEAWKADGHLKFSGETNDIPKRRFLPAEGQEFVGEIQKEVEKIVADHVLESTRFEKSDFEDVENKSGLYNALKDIFPELTRAEIRSAVARTPKLVRMLDDLGLLDFLED